MTSSAEKTSPAQPQPHRVPDREDPSWDYGNPFTGGPATVVDGSPGTQAEADAPPAATS